MSNGCKEQQDQGQGVIRVSLTELKSKKKSKTGGLRKC